MKTKGFGGKHQKIINCIPPHDFYFEPFATMQNTLLKFKKLSGSSIINAFSPRDYLDISEYIEQEMNGKVKEATVTDDSITYVVQGKKVELWHKTPNMVLGECSKIVLSSPALKCFIYLNIPQDCKDIFYEQLPKCNILAEGYFDGLMPCEQERFIDVKDFSLSKRGRSERIILSMNYEVKELHEYTYLGEDYREREQFSKISIRWLSRLKEQPQQLQFKIIEEFNNYLHLKNLAK